MADETTDSAGTAEPSAIPASPLESPPSQPVGIGASIVQSFKNSVDRLKADDVPAGPGLDQTAAMYVPDMAPAPTSHLGKSMTVPFTKPEPDRIKKERRPVATNQARRARLRVSRVDPWSVMKTALLFGVAMWIIFIVATWVVFTVLDGTGLYEAVNSTVAQVFTPTGTNALFNIRDFVNTTRATAIAALVGAVNVVIVTALATIFAFLYNLSAAVMGGIEFTLAED